jgi:hypothetical protein
MPKIKDRRGSTLVEFALVAAFILVPLTLGVMTIGMTLARTVRVYQLTRDAAHMFARGVDLSSAGSRALILRMAEGLGITNSGGNGVIIVSQIECATAGQAVCTRRVVIGNAGLRSSNFASPTHIDSTGNVDYVHDQAARADSFLSVMPMSPGESTFLVESYFSSADYDWVGFWSGHGIYSMAVF